MFRSLFKYITEVKKATALRSVDYTEELVLWDFTRRASLQKWDCISDEDIGGQSRAKFEPNGKGQT